MIILVAACAGLRAQSAQIAQMAVGSALSDPSSSSVVGRISLGLTFDETSGTLRQVTGIPGAAHSGAPLELGVKLAWAAVSPAQDHVLAASRDSQEVLLFQIRSGGISMRPLRDVPPAPDRVALSPSGAAAALYYSDAGMVRVLANLEDGAASRSFNLAGAPSALAVSDDGQAALVIIPGEGEVQTLLWTGDAGVRRIVDSYGAAAAAFFRGSQDAVIADGMKRYFYRLRTSKGVDTLEIAGDFDGDASGPVALKLAHDNTRVFAAIGNGNRVEVLDVAGRSITRLECACKPSALTALNGSLFRLTGGDGQRFWILDGGASQPRLLFVPQLSDREDKHE
jgi:hypothetical protein